MGESGLTGFRRVDDGMQNLIDRAAAPDGVAATVAGRAQERCLVLGNRASRQWVLQHMTGVKVLAARDSFDPEQPGEWRPDFYSCLGPDLARAKAGRIAELVAEGRIERYFLSTAVLDSAPALRGHPRVDFYEGADDAASPVHPDVALLRWAIGLGFTTVGVAGLGERKTRKRNDDTLPQSCRDLSRELLESSRLVTITVLDQASDRRLQGLFPFNEPLPFLGVPLFGAVAIPLVAAEIERGLKQLAQWDVIGHTPYSYTPEAPQVDLMYCFAGSRDAELERRITEAYEATTYVKRMFRQLRVMFCGLTTEEQRYVRTMQGLPPRDGYKAGPNNLYFATMRCAKTRGSVYSFLMETDITPVKPGWLADLEEECRRFYGSWVIGSHYRGYGPMGKPFMRHINGNALYALGIEEFHDFLWNTFRPWLYNYVANVEPVLAYDCGWDLLIGQAQSDDPSDPLWGIVRRCLHKFKHTERIVNIGGEMERLQVHKWGIADVRERFPLCSIIHGPLALTDEPVLEIKDEKPEWEPELSSITAIGLYFNRFFSVGESQILSSTSGQVRGTGERDHICWAFGIKNQSFAPGDVIRARIAIKAGDRCNARVILANFDAGRYERSEHRLELGRKAAITNLVHEVVSEHEIFRVQVGSTSMWHEFVTLTFEEIEVEVIRGGQPLGFLRLGGPAKGKRTKQLTEAARAVAFSATQSPSPNAEVEGEEAGTLTRDYVDNLGVPIRLTLPRPANRESCFALGLHRGGSTLLSATVSRLCSHGKFPAVSLDKQLAELGYPVEETPREVFKLWYESGYCFTGIRRFDPFFDTSYFRNGPPKIMLVRDPRDVVTSLYLARGKGADARGKDAGPLTIEDFIKGGHADEALGHMRRFAGLVGAARLHLFRYEDVIKNQRAWMVQVGEVIGVPTPDRLLDNMCSRFEGMNQEEPGHYRQHLGKKALKDLERQCGDVLQAFNYR